MASLKAFEEELLVFICNAPSYCLNKEMLAAGTFCWSWLSVMPEVSRESLYMNLRYSLLLSLNAGGIYESTSIQSALIADSSFVSDVMDCPKKKPLDRITNRRGESFMRLLFPRKVAGDRLSNLTYDEYGHNLSRENILEAFELWLKFLTNQVKVRLRQA